MGAAGRGSWSGSGRCSTGIGDFVAVGVGAGDEPVQRSAPQVIGHLSDGDGVGGDTTEFGGSRVVGRGWWSRRVGDGTSGVAESRAWLRLLDPGAPGDPGSRSR